MIIHRDIQQGSLDWFNLRCGVVTASEMDRLVTPAKLEAVKGKGLASYLAEKLAERWGGPLPGANTWDMDQGRILEDEARPAFEIETGLTVTTVGFVSDDAGHVGCSPDGVIMDGDKVVSGVEIKCPLPQTQIKYLLAGELPVEYRLQVHASMVVTGAPCWWFFSYRRRMPPLCLRVERDPEICDAINAALGPFLCDMEFCWQKLVDMNGGEPLDWRVAPARPSVQPALPENDDVPTP